MRRIIGRGLAFALLAIIAAVTAGTFIPRPLFPSDGAVGGDTRRIRVLANPIHTDIAVPADADVLARFGFLAASGMPVDHPDVRWLVIGWGSRSFYLETPTWSELKPMPVLKALTLDRSVLHVDVWADFALPQPNVTEFDLDAAGFDRLLTFIEQSFVGEGTGEAAAIPGAGYGEFDRFFPADGYFNALVGCNTWAAGALRAGGLQTGWWNPLPQTLAFSLKLQNP